MKKSKIMKSVILTSVVLGISVLLLHAFHATDGKLIGTSLIGEKTQDQKSVASLREEKQGKKKEKVKNDEDSQYIAAADAAPSSDGIYDNDIDTYKISRGAESTFPDRKSILKNNQTTSVATPTAQAPTLQKVQQQPNPTNATNEVDLLARLIMAEAQGESYDAKVAVGAVVMNRVQSGAFPNSIQGVIYQKISGYYQFTPVANGWINKPANTESINAAKAALSGVDATKGALFYYDNTTTNQWMLSKPVSVKIGNMVFAY